jgi:hypothetical protein
MPVYELINPSDAYTFEAPNIEVAGVCAVLLSCNFGAKQVDGDGERTPIIWGWNEWLEDRGIDADFLTEHAAEIADAYDSFLIGGPDKRADVESMLAMLPEDKRQEWKAQRQDRHRTSLNRIGEVAYKYAAKYRELANKQEAL